jgi:hypothetical protein
MRYSRIAPGEKLDFFANYYSPIWSILYWLCHSQILPFKRLKKWDVASAVRAQSMAMFLHSLDDHLIDGQIPVSPLTLLLRSQAWTIMNRSFCNLAQDLPAGERTVRNFVGDYYSSLQDSRGPESLDGYCDLFRRQMAILMVAPILLSVKMTRVLDFVKDIEIAYGSFGIAWRLLDDINDIADDMEKGAHSSVYLCLPEELKILWNNNAGARSSSARDSASAIVNHILEHGLVDRIKGRICTELREAASIVEGQHLTGLAREFRCLAYPLGKSDSNEEEEDGRPEISLASK